MHIRRNVEHVCIFQWLERLARLRLSREATLGSKFEKDGRNTFFMLAARIHGCDVIKRREQSARWEHAVPRERWQYGAASSRHVFCVRRRSF